MLYFVQQFGNDLLMQLIWTKRSAHTKKREHEFASRKVSSFY